MIPSTKEDVLYSLRERLAWYAANKPPSCITSATLRTETEKNTSTSPDGEWHYADDATGTYITREFLRPKDAVRIAKRKAYRKQRSEESRESIGRRSTVNGRGR